MNQIAIMKLIESGAFDKLFKMFGGKKADNKVAATELVEDYTAVKEELAEVKAKLSALMKHLKIDIVKEKYKVVKNVQP